MDWRLKDLTEFSQGAEQGVQPGLLGLRAAALTTGFLIPARGDAGAGAWTGSPGSAVMGFCRGPGGSHAPHTAERGKSEERDCFAVLNGDKRSF